MDRKTGILLVVALFGVAALAYMKRGAIMTAIQSISNAGIDAIARIEGFRAFKYEDPPGSGLYSIGYGHQIQPGESFDEPMSQDTAKQLLSADTLKAQNAVRSAVTVPLTQEQFDALVSFVFNVGIGSFTSGTVPAKLNAGNFAAAAATMRQYVHTATGEVSPVLQARRDKEASVFG